MKFRKTIAMLLAVSMLFTGNGFTALALEPDDHAVGSSQVQDSGFVSNEETLNDDDFSDSGTAESDGPTDGISSPDIEDETVEQDDDIEQDDSVEDNDGGPKYELQYYLDACKRFMLAEHQYYSLEQTTDEDEDNFCELEDKFFELMQPIYDRVEEYNDLDDEQLEDEEITSQLLPYIEIYEAVEALRDGGYECECEDARCADGAANAHCLTCVIDGIESCKYTDPVDEAVEQVRLLIDALPSVEELSEMPLDEQGEYYNLTLVADEAYRALSDELKAQLAEENEKLDELFAYFASPQLTAPALYAEAKWGASADDLISGTLSAAFAARPAYIQLQTSVTLNEGITMSSGTTTLDLNGKTVTIADSTNGDIPTITVEGGTLTLMDSAGGGSVVGGKGQDSHGSSAVSVENGTLNIGDGSSTNNFTLTGGDSESEDEVGGVGIYSGDEGTVTVNQAFTVEGGQNSGSYHRAITSWGTFNGNNYAITVTGSIGISSGTATDLNAIVTDATDATDALIVTGSASNVTISGGNYTGTRYGLWIRGSSSTEGTLKISGGTFSGGDTAIKNERYDSYEEILADGCIYTDGESDNAITEETAFEAATKLVVKSGGSSSGEHTDHCVCGGSISVGGHTHDSTAPTWTAWNGTDSITYDSDTSTAYVYLSADAERPYELSIPANRKLYLCLNGNTLDLNGKYILVNNGAELNLCDCSAGKTGTITGGGGLSSSRGGGAVYMYVNTTFNMYGGNITGNTVSVDSSSTAGGGVYVASDSTFNMYGGTISNNSANMGGGVCVNGSFTMYDGTISNNSTTAYTGSEGEHGGGGVALNSGSFAMNDGTISGNKAEYNGGGVYLLKNSSFTMNGGSITGNSCTTTNYRHTGGGGGVSVSSHDNNSFTMTGGSITGNTTAIKYGGGVFIGSMSGTEFSVSGNPIIMDNTSASVTNNVYISNGSYPITISGALGSNANIGVTRTGNTGTFAKPVGATITDATPYAGCFESDNESYTVLPDGVNLKLMAIPTHSHYTCGAEDCTDDTHNHSEADKWIPLSYVLTDNGDGTYTGTLTGGNYYLDKDMTVKGTSNYNNDPCIDISGSASTPAHVNLCLNGHQLTGSPKDITLRVSGGNNEANASLSICDCYSSSTHTGEEYTHIYISPISGEEKTVTGGLITGAINSGGHTMYVNNAQLNLYGGTFAGNGNGENGGGAIYMSNSALHFYGGSITDNYLSSGGALAMESSKANLIGGSVTGNAAYDGVTDEGDDDNVGGVRLFGTSTATIHSDFEISENKAGLGAGESIDSNLLLGLRYNGTPWEIKLTGPMDTPIGLSMYEPGIFTSGFGSTGGTSLNDFVCEKRGYFLTTEGEGNAAEAKMEAYAITTQPTTDSPQVSTNKDDDVAAYSWHNSASAVVDSSSATALDESICADGVWSGTPSGSGYNIYFFQMDLNAGDTLTATLTNNGDFYRIVLDGQNTEQISIDEDGTTYVFEISATDTYVLWVAEARDDTTPTFSVVHSSVGAAVSGQTTSTLTNGTDGENYVCKVTFEDGTVLVSDAVEYDVPAPALTGTVIISGEPTPGLVLTAAVSGSNNTGTLSYQWQRVDNSTTPATVTDIAGATEEIYTVTDGDAGYTLRCVVTGSENSGSISGDTTKAVGPVAPTLSAQSESVSGANDGKITGVNDTMEYSIDGGNIWTSVLEGQTEITGLAPGSVLVRVKETDTANCGKSVELTIAVGPAIVVTFDGNAPDGLSVTAPSAPTGLVYGSKLTQPDAPTLSDADVNDYVSPDDYEFDGWYKDNTCTTPWDFASDTLTGNTTIYAKWVKVNFTVKVTVTDGTNNIDAAAVKLMRGSEVIDKGGVTANGGVYVFTSHVPAGIYNIVATRTVNDEPQTKTMFFKVTASDVEETITMIEGANSVLQNGSGLAENIVVSGLDTYVENEKSASSDNYTATMKIVEAPANTPGISNIKSKAQEDGLGKVHYLDATIQLKKNDGPPQEIKELGVVMQMVIPFDFSNVKDNTIKVYRYHINEDGSNNGVEFFTENDTGADKTFQVDKPNGIIHLFGNHFSVYAIGYEEIQSTNPGGNTNGSGSGSSYDDSDDDSTYRDYEEEFWKQVHDKIESTQSGYKVIARAGGYDRMPAYVMEALLEHDEIMLEIHWNGGDTITIPAGKALDEQNRIYYPLSYLAGYNFGSVDWSKSNPETGGVLEITAPAISNRIVTPDGKPEITDHRRGTAVTIEDAVNGIEKTIPGVFEPEITSQVLTEPQRKSGIINGSWMLLSVLIVGGGWISFRKRKVPNK